MKKVQELRVMNLDPEIILEDKTEDQIEEDDSIDLSLS
jgi:hypothetical protein